MADHAASGNGLDALHEAAMAAPGYPGFYALSVSVGSAEGFSDTLQMTDQYADAVFHMTDGLRNEIGGKYRTAGPRSWRYDPQVDPIMNVNNYGVYARPSPEEIEMIAEQEAANVAWSITIHCQDEPEGESFDY